MTAFHVFLRAVLERAGHEAQGERSAMVEAQHVLLAMASPSDAESRELLESLGLDRQALRAALDSEFRQALSAAGVSLEASEPQRADCTTSSSAPPLGTSVRHALERGLGSTRDAPRPAHLLLGILEAEVGTVPRALELAGFDRAALIARVRATLQAR
jgi:ATP-dependent Clp protease ATP-binding subunit ClpA